jgi:hypothetical protein
MKGRIQTKGETNMRGAIAALILIASVGASWASDTSDRSLGIEMNRDRSENRIQRLREDRQQSDKARAESPKKDTDIQRAKKKESGKDK